MRWPFSKRETAVIISFLILLRAIFAAIVPIAYDEAYYWLWSKNLAASYFDHPPAVALLIRLGTAIAGDGVFGVRIASVLLAIPASWCVFQAGKLFFDESAGLAAALLLNCTLLVAAGSIIVTPDSPLMFAASLLLYCSAKLWATQRGRWWLGVGAAGGLALLSKYNALFIGLATAIWTITVPEMRKWLRTPWPYLGGLVAAALFSPVVIWNYQHEWASFGKQFGRAVAKHFTFRYFFEFFPTQIGLATPPVFILGCLGLWKCLRYRGDDLSGRVLIAATILPTVIYFLWHSLHARVEGNWLAAIYPAFSIAAAYAAENRFWQGRVREAVVFSRRWALPVALAIFLPVAVQAAFGVVQFGRVDPTARNLGAGWPQLAREIEDLRKKTGAEAIISVQYATNAWLAFYLPRQVPLMQITDCIRYTGMPPFDRSKLQKVLYVLRESDLDRAQNTFGQFERVTKVEELPRLRGRLRIDNYIVLLADGFKGSSYCNESYRGF